LVHRQRLSRIHSDLLRRVQWLMHLNLLFPTREEITVWHF
jgi:hypothetical protein